MSMHSSFRIHSGSKKKNTHAGQARASERKRKHHRNRTPFSHEAFMEAQRHGAGRNIKPRAVIDHEFARDIAQRAARDAARERDSVNRRHGLTY